MDAMIVIAQIVWTEVFFRASAQLGPILAVATALLHVVLAFAVMADSQLLWKHRRRKTFLVGGGMWAVATLLGGMLTAALYWLIHHSTLSPEVPSNLRELNQDSQPTQRS